MKRDNFPLLQSLNILQRKLEQDVVDHLSAVAAFIQKELPKALEQGTTQEENDAIDNVYQQAMSIVRNVLQKYLSPSEPHEESEKLCKSLICNFPLDDLKYASFWYPIWNLLARFLFKNAHLLMHLESSFIPKVQTGCLDFRGKTGDAFMLGKTVVALLRFLGKNAETLSQDSIERLLTAVVALQFDSPSELEAVAIAIRDLKSAVKNENLLEFPSSFLSTQELCFKLFPFVIFCNSLGKTEQQEVASMLLLDTLHVRYTHLLISTLLVRTCSPNILVAAHTLLDTNCLFKSMNLARILPLSLCTPELVNRDLIFDAFANIFGELSSNAHLQLKGHALEIIGLLPQYAAYLDPEVFTRLLISLSKHLDDLRMLDCVKLFSLTKLTAADISALALFSLFAQHQLKNISLKATLFDILELCTMQASSGTAARFLCLQYICYYIARNTNLEVMERPIFNEISDRITRFFARECDRSFNHRKLLQPPIFTELPTKSFFAPDWSLCQSLLTKFASNDHSRKNCNDQKRLFFQINKLLC